MGGLFSYFRGLLGNREMRILILGLDGAGKTTILYRLQVGEVVTTIPTIGFNVEQVTYKNLKFQVWDLGGQTSIRPYWRCYYSNTDAIIYVVDSADKDRIGISKDELLYMLRPFKLHNLQTGPPTSATISKDEAIDHYTKMQTIRRLETSAGNLYKEKIVRGFCHLYSGQEACAVGMKAAMRPQDNIISAYRVHGWTYLMGVSPKGVLAELTGKQGGCARGKGGSMHMYAPNFYGGNGIVGAQVPLGAGVALACQYKGNNGVCLALYGDGASNQGQVFEAYNMAHLWKLPCIFVCENNGYGMGTSADRSSCNTNYFQRGDVLPGIWVDGMDVVAVKLATDFAIDYVLKNGPIVMEVFTYRYSGHSMSDPGTSYRTRDEVQEVRQTRDPITSYKEKIITAGLVTPDEIKKIDIDIKKEVDEATKWAKADTEIGLSELTTDIYAQNLEGDIRGSNPNSWFKHSSLNKAVNL